MKCPICTPKQQLLDAREEPRLQVGIGLGGSRSQTPILVIDPHPKHWAFWLFHINPESIASTMNDPAACCRVSKGYKILFFSCHSGLAKACFVVDTGDSRKVRTFQILLDPASHLVPRDLAGMTNCD